MTWITTDLLLDRTWRKNFSEIQVKMQNFFQKNVACKTAATLFPLWYI